MSHESVVFGAKLTARYYAKGAKGKLIVFLPRPLEDHKHNTSSTEIKVGGDEQTEIGVRIPRALPMDTPVLVHWRTRRIMHGESHYDNDHDEKSLPGDGVLLQPYESRAGTGRTTLDMVERGVVVPLLDIDDDPVGEVYLSVLRVPERSVLLLPATGKYNTHVHIEQLAKEEDRRVLSNIIPRHSNIDYIQNWHFGVIITPVGRIPLYEFARQAISGSHMDHSTDAALLLNFANHSLDSMFLTQQQVLSDELPPAVMAELMGEIQTLVTRYMLYVKDSSKRNGDDKANDDFDFPRDGSLSVDDCEGYNAIVHECIYKFRNRSVPFDHPLLKRLVNFDMQYIPLFALVTLKVGDTGWTYHACTIKLDRSWFMEKIGLTNESSSPPSSSRRLLPACVLEPTTYTTSCHAYRHPSVTRDTYSRSHLLKPVESNTKIPGDLVPGIYRHVVVVTCPELLASHNIARIDCIYNGRSAIPIQRLLSYSDDVVLKASSYEGGKAAIDTISNTLDCLPRLSRMRPPSDQKQHIKTLVAAPLSAHNWHYPEFNACYRSCDWVQGMEKQIMKQAGLSQVEVTELQLTSRLSGIRVRGWL